ncbi:MAG: long-chain fatty acid--CoA ligase [Betaproteobacteria bacterium]|nr:long-chain fatty acid--CoA ligase [Betaproteobacteria bacterium]
MEEEETVAMTTDTIAKMFWQGVQSRGAQTIVRQKELGLWKAVSWTQLGETAREIGLGLVALGFNPGEVAAILSNTNREWVFADLGVLGAAGVVNGIYPTDAPSQVEYLLNDSATVYLFVEDDEQLDKVLEVRSRVPRLRKIIVFDMEGLDDLQDDAVMSLDALRATGRAYFALHPEQWDIRVDMRKASDLAILVYTSGTTGRPKGAMLSHANVLATVKAYQARFPQSETDERICFLPLCHIAERVGGEYQALYSGAVLNFVENPDTVPENVQEIAPTVFVAVPRVWEKFYSGVLIRVREATRIQQWAYQRAMTLGLQRARRIEEGKTVPTWLEALFRLAYVLVLSNVRKVIGVDRARILITGAAPISPDLVRWYLALGLEMIEVWGQTESCGAVTANHIGKVRPGSIGVCLEPTEVKLSPAGELLVRGPGVFMGYLNQPEQSAAAIVDGWLHTGDIGRVDSDGYFYGSERMKDIIITAGGKNITPTEIENQLKFSPYITDAVVIGDQRPFLAALIMIDHENVEQYAQERAIPFSNYASLCKRPEIIALIQAEVDKVNVHFARVEQIKQFRLLETKLTAEDEELTPTMKLKRSFVNKKYESLIEAMYASRA